jgi:hypothetical protein
MKKDEAEKTVKAATKNGALAKMLVNMFTTEAKETEANTRKTTKTAVNLLSILSPAFLASLTKRFFL